MTDAVRLAGTWVVPEVALKAAAAYGVTDLIQVRTPADYLPCNDPRDSY